MAERCDALAGTSIRSSPLTRGIMASSARLRIVAKYIMGGDDVDVEAATDLDILVTHTPTESNWGDVAEGTITAMLTMLKKIRERDWHLKDGTPGGTSSSREPMWVRADSYAGITLGLIGLGHIGSRVATLMRPWQARMLAYDLYVLDTKFSEHGMQRVNLDTLLRESGVYGGQPVLVSEGHNLAAQPIEQQRIP
jgi:D-3-phosphoglycerate dehydrogenase